MAPYVSIRRLADNSISAMLAAIEIYNKPSVAYREETTIVLLVNAWELALKALLRNHQVAIFYVKKRGASYRSLTLDDSIGKVTGQNLWPTGIDGRAVTTNLKALTTFRDRAIHLYNAKNLAALVYPFLQQSILNYRDLMVAAFNKDLADSISWQLVPLAAHVPIEEIQFMKADPARSVGAELRHFIQDLKAMLDHAENTNQDLGRIAAYYDVNLRSVKQMASADLVVAVSPTATGQVVIKKVNPNDSHPHSMADMLKKANARRVGRKLTTFDHQAICWKRGLRSDERYAWRHGQSVSYGWSDEAISLFARLPDAECEKIRKEYNESRKRRAGAN